MSLRVTQQHTVNMAQSDVGLHLCAMLTICACAEDHFLEISAKHD